MPPRRKKEENKTGSEGNQYWSFGAGHTYPNAFIAQVAACRQG
jgi:hypothetical protein